MTILHSAPHKLDWETLGHSGVETNGHVQVEHRDGAWGSPLFKKDPMIQLHGLSTALNYGQQCYEGLKAYRNASGEICAIQIEQHAERMQQSARSVSMPAVAVELFTKCVELAVARNAEFVPPHDSRAFLYIRPVMFAGGSHIALSPARMYTLCVFVTPATAPPPGISLRALIVEQFDRTAPKGCGSKKVGGNYAPVMQYVESAKDQGYSITIHLDSLTGLQVEEFASCAFVAVREGSAEPALVIPDSRNVLHSTTVRAIEALWKEKGWKVERRPIYVSELSSFTEVMAVGTASGIISIASITQDSVPKTVNYDVAAGGPARYAKEWTVDLDAIHHGIVPDRFGWLYQILPISNVDGSS